jgi:hypothetical protein
VQTALPLMFMILIAVQVNNKAFDGIHKRLHDIVSDMNPRFDEILERLDRIETKLDGHETRIARLEECTSPIGRR